MHHSNCTTTQLLPSHNASAVLVTVSIGARFNSSQHQTLNHSFTGGVVADLLETTSTTLFLPADCSTASTSTLPTCVHGKSQAPTLTTMPPARRGHAMFFLSNCQQETSEPTSYETALSEGLGICIPDTLVQPARCPHDFNGDKAAEMAIHPAEAEGLPSSLSKHSTLPIANPGLHYGCHAADKF